MLRQKFLILVLVFVMVLGVGFGTTTAQQELTDVTQVGFLVVDIAPLLIGIENGYFADEGLNMRYVEIDSGQLGVGAVYTGLADFVDLGVEDVVDLQAQGKDVILVYSMVDNLTMDMVVRNEVLEEKGITHDSSLEDRYAALQGMTFGITRPGAPTELYPKWFLTQAGLNPDTDANFVAVGSGAALLAALESGQIDAYMLSAPTPYTAQNEGIGTILIQNSAGDVPQFSDFAFESITVRRQFAEEHPELVEGYSRAMDRANQFLLEHTDEALTILHDKYFPDTDMDTLRISLEATLPAINPDGDLSEQAIINQLQVLIDLGIIESMPDTSEGVLWTNQYNPKTLGAEAEATPAS
jgi:ABC-type nitrate/sulfonate/bicarbonate transport system substrate-binding protein